MVRMFGKFALPAIALLAVAMFAPQAKAQQDFACSGISVCAGTVNVSGGNYSSTSISLTASSPWILTSVGDGDEAGETFTMAFDTNANTISLTDATDADASISGTIIGFTAVTSSGITSINLFVNWNIPGFHGGFGTVTFNVSGGQAFSVDMAVLPSPEPGSLLLLGTGLLGMGAAVRRRWLS